MAKDDNYSTMKSMSRNMRPGGGPRVSNAKWSTGGYKAGDYAKTRAAQPSENAAMNMARNLRPGGGPRISNAKWATAPYKPGDYAGYRMGQNLTVPKPKAKPANPVNVVRDVVRTATDMKTTPAKAAGPKRMAINPRTGSTLGFTTGSKTGSTATKSGTAFRTPMTPGQRASRASFDRSGVAGPSKDSSGRNRSSATGKGAFGGGKKK